MSFRKKRIAWTRAAFVPVIFLGLFVRPGWSLDSTTAFCVESAGYFFLLAGLAVRMWSILYVGGRKSHELVTDGPYSICRNPLYFGTFLLGIGIGLCFENLLMLVAIFLIIVPAHLWTARLEERHLLELFPDIYPDYAKSVPSFWPKFSNYRSRESVTVPVRVMRRIAVDTMGVLLIPWLEDLSEVLHHHNIIPWQFTFPPQGW